MYAKVFRQMYDGTLATNGPWEALVTFQQMLVLANDQGEVDMTASAIARTTTIPLNIIERGIGALMAPDPESRTPDEEGRRIVPLSEHRAWGWRIVNYLKYRAIQKEMERRDYHRRYYHEKRKKPVELNASQHISTASTVSTDTEAEVEAEAYAHFGVPPEPPAPSARSGKVARKRAPKPATSSETWAAYAGAYRERYGAEPVRNAKVNGQLAQLVARLGADEAPGVARFYIGNRNALYVNAKHCTDLLLRDAEKLRTEWVTGDVTHQRDASEADRLGSQGAMWARVGDKLRAKGIIE